MKKENEEIKQNELKEEKVQNEEKEEKESKDIIIINEENKIKENEEEIIINPIKIEEEKDNNKNDTEPKENKINPEINIVIKDSNNENNNQNNDETNNDNKKESINTDNTNINIKRNSLLYIIKDKIQDLSGNKKPKEEKQEIQKEIKEDIKDENNIKIIETPKKKVILETKTNIDNKHKDNQNEKMSDDDDNSVDDEIVPYPGKKRKSEILKTWKKKIEKGDNKEFGKERKDENTQNTIKRTMTEFYNQYELSRISKSKRLQYKLKKMQKEDK